MYRLHITNAINWMKEFFVQNEKTTELVNQLEQLKTQAIDVKYPQSLKAKQALDEVSQQQVYRWLENSLQQNPPSSSETPSEQVVPENLQQPEPEDAQSAEDGGSDQ